jgi:two-component system chemotaxis response regulator CheB
MIRVVLAEDSETCRQLLTAVLESDGELKIVGHAPDGQSAVALTEALRPDVVVMDAHMPVMDGFVATRQIMLQSPTPIVIVSATMDVASVAASMRALEAGALTLLPKPQGPSAPGFDELARAFVNTVRAMADVKVVRRWNGVVAHGPRPPELPDPRKRVRVIGVGASTGGPAALQHILHDLPERLEVPMLVVQHIAHGFLEGLTTWLQAVTTFRVTVAEQGERPQAGCVYFAPDHCHLAVGRDGSIDLTQRKPVSGFVPSATVLFESLAEAFGASAVGLILTGMGQDGVAGLTALRRVGATVIAQDEETSVVFGMPKAAVEAGVTSSVLPLPLIAARLAQLSRQAPRAVNEGKKERP